MQDSTKSKLIWIFNIIVMLVLIVVVVQSKEKPREGYNYVFQCLSFFGSNECKFVDAAIETCYNNCTFPENMTEIGQEDLPIYCDDIKRLVCRDYIKLERIQG